MAKQTLTHDAAVNSSHYAELKFPDRDAVAALATLQGGGGVNSSSVTQTSLKRAALQRPVTKT